MSRPTITPRGTPGRFTEAAAVELRVVDDTDTDSPRALRWGLHLANARLFAETQGFRPGCTPTSHPAELRRQTAQMRWDLLSEAEQLEGEQAFRQEHGWCHPERCPIARRMR